MATNLQLRDGETQVLAGLISNDDRRSADRVPGLGELPVAGRLFSHTLDNSNRTEIVLLITPHIVRTLARPDAAAVEFAAGTESSTGSPRLGAAPPSVPPIPAPAPTPDVSSVPPVVPSVPTYSAPAAPSSVAPLTVPFGGIKPSPQ